MKENKNNELIKKEKKTKQGVQLAEKQLVLRSLHNIVRRHQNVK